MTPQNALRAQTASLSHVGQVRSVNQDICGEFADALGHRLLVVADGMGGHAGGETASRMALETIGEVFGAGFEDSGGMLRDALRVANEKIHRVGNEVAELHNMGTTVVALLLGPGSTAWVAHVGDSRAYLMRSGQLEQITDDHSWVSEEVRHKRLKAEEAESHPMKNVLLRSIGVAAEVDVALSRHSVESGDRFMLCSDGLWGEVNYDAISHIVGARDAPTGVQELVDLANQNGGSDNVTVQIAIVEQCPDEITLETEVAASESETLSVEVELPEESTVPTLPTPLPDSARGGWSGPAIAFVAGLVTVLVLWAVL
jgi:protein phosphatase